MMSFLINKITVSFFLFKDILTRSICVHAYVYFKGNKLVKTNWGDDINYSFLRKITRRPISIYQYSFLANRFKKKNYLCIGSTINLLSTPESIIWGAGVISNDLELPHIPKKICAVRGPLSRKYLLERGIECPAIYGDPALLIYYFYRPKINKESKIGIIPHYSDLESDIVKQLSLNADIKIINIKNYSSWFSFVDEILSCECIASSSLHGLIISEAYSRPNVWIEFSNQVYGGHFKFHDFFMSIGKDRCNPLKSYDITIEKIIEDCKTWRKSEIDLTQLIESCPFKLNLPYWHKK